MDWGIQTWDENGIPNNYGIKPISVVGRILLSEGQNSGSWSFPTPAGMKVGFAIALDKGGFSVGRRIVANGNAILLSAASNTGVGNYPASECELIVYLEKA
ncbi:hypothetical protein [Leclercia sp. UBA7405]|uniref:hypothetical protein n=1 Tax=Leclercia sp. UBA7405 TaxID=1946743 RepID=UPI003015EE1B